MLNFSRQIEYLAPKANELEISLFGPGVGECIAVHLGQGRWMIVDSCLNPATKNPIALDYLEKLGVEPSIAVELVVISHWHSDHIRGASKIVASCPSARICYSSALLKLEFLSLVSAFSGLGRTILLDRETCGTSEMASIIKILHERCKAKEDYKLEYMVPTMADRILFHNQTMGFQSEVRALSPSNKSFHNALLEFASLIPDIKGLRGVIPSPKQNNNAIVIWVQFGSEIKILLGADLEETTDPLTGWSVIVNSPTRPNGKASIFKIPHHGSSTAHSNGVWGNMVEPEALGILSAKIGGRSSIPKQSDISRLKNYTPILCCTSEPVAKRIKRDKTVEKAMKEIVKSRKILGGDIGHIQARMFPNSEMRVNLKSPAVPL